MENLFKKPTPKIERAPTDQQPTYEKLKGFFDEARKYAELGLRNGKLTVALVVSMGAFETVAASPQTDSLSHHLEYSITQGQDLNAVVSDTYTQYLQASSDSSFASVESVTSSQGQTFETHSEIKGRPLQLPEIVTTGDTINLGGAEVRTLGVVGLENKNDSTGVHSRHDMRNSFGVKVNSEYASNSSERRSMFATGATPQEAVINALGMASTLESSTVSVATQSTIESSQDHSSENFVQLSVDQSQNQFNNVQVVFHETSPGGFSVEVIY